MNFPLNDQQLSKRTRAFENFVASLGNAVKNLRSDMGHDTEDYDPERIPGQDGAASTYMNRLNAALADFHQLTKEIDASQHVATGALLSVQVEECLVSDQYRMDDNHGADWPSADGFGTEFAHAATPATEARKKAVGISSVRTTGLPVEFVNNPQAMKAFAEAKYILSTELACLLSCSEPHAHELMQQSVLLMHSPELEKVHRMGKVSWRNMQEVLEYSNDLPAQKLFAYGQRMAEFLAPRSGAHPVRSRSQVRQRAQYVREELHEEPLVDRRSRSVKDRKVYVDRECNGMATLCALLPAETAHAIFNTLSDIAHFTKKTLGLAGSDGEKPDVRTVAQIRADALADLLLATPSASQLGPKCRTAPGVNVVDTFDLNLTADTDQSAHVVSDNDPCSEAGNYDATGSTPDSIHEDGNDSLDEPFITSGLRPKIFVTVSAETLAGFNEDNALLHGYGLIPAATVRQLAAQAPTLYRLLSDPVTGVVLDLERKQYRVTQELRDFLHLRSQTCQFPGCNRAARYTDADHVAEWNEGGSTSPDNLQLLCRKHHNMKTHFRWKCALNSDGTLTWVSPLGNRYDTAHVNPAPRSVKPEFEYHVLSSSSNELAEELKAEEDPPF